MDTKILLRKNTKCFYDPKNGNLIPLILMQDYEIDYPEFLPISINDQMYILIRDFSDTNVPEYTNSFKLLKGTLVREEYGLPIALACDIDIFLDNNIPIILNKGTKIRSYNGSMHLTVKKDTIALINDTYFTYFYHGNIILDYDAEYFIDHTFKNFLEVKKSKIMFLNGIKIDYDENISLVNDFMRVNKNTFEVVFKYQ